MKGSVAVREIQAYLLAPGSQVPVGAAIGQLLDVAGLYAITVQAPACLPPFFGSLLLERQHACLYIGRTSKGRIPSLKRRLGNYDLRGKGDSTFFSALGVMLGYRPPIGSLVGKKDNNIRFSTDDRNRVAAWVEQNLTVAWRVLDPATVEDLEPQLIRAIKPLLNWKHNPAKLEKLKVLRDGARRWARGCAAR